MAHGTQRQPRAGIGRKYQAEDAPDGVSHTSPIDALSTNATNDLDIVELDERIALDEIPPEVRQANLYLYSDQALAGRLAHYQREGLLERDATLRAAWKAEAQRTQIEINRRKMYRQREADRVFEL